MASIFEKTMAACLESKKDTQKSGKKLKESAKVPMKRKVVESDDITDTELDTITDDATDDEVMDDVVDDIVVVVDPELDEEDISSAASDAQDIIDNTPDGQVPTTDEYVGDLTYTCPICGNTFFSEVEMNDGDECPVCGDFPNGYVLVGEVADTEGEDEEIEEPVNAEDSEDFEDEPEDIDSDEELEPDITDDALESYRKSRKVSKSESRSRFSIDESTFNPFMNKFIRENYRNAKSFEIVGAKLSGKTLSLECKLVFKSGKSKKVTLKSENFMPRAKDSLVVRDDGTFKTESRSAKVAPFIFSTVTSKSGIIRCEGLKYNLITKAVKEGKRVQISGKLIKESKSR